MKEDRIYLHHILEAIAAIEEYTAEGKRAFSDKRLIQDGVIRNLEVIGEAVKNLSPDLRDNPPNVPWRKIAGLRDVLIHQYFGVDLDSVWLVVQNRLPVLKTHVLALLKNQQPG